MKIFRIILLSVLVFPMALSNYSPASTSETKQLSQGEIRKNEDEELEDLLRMLRQQQKEIDEGPLLYDMDRAMEKFNQDQDEISRLEYEALLIRALALPGLSVRAYSACATAANLLGRPQQAIEILKQLIDTYPDNRAFQTTFPLRFAGYYRIGSLAMVVGDANEATRAYKAAIDNCEGFFLDSFYKITCRMHLVDIAERMLNDKKLAMERCNDIVAEIDSVYSNEQQGKDKSLIFLKGWALYKQKYLETGMAPSRDVSDLNNEDYNILFTLAMTHLKMSCDNLHECEQIIRNDNSSLNTVLIRFALAINDMHYERTEEAEKHLLGIVETDSYFKVNAQSILKSLQKLKENISRRIPMYLENLKSGDSMQREAAAMHLARAPEGIKLLCQAQQDPNKYVRYAAACNIAKWNKDPAYKADFNIILEALTDEDPQVRNTAGRLFSPIQGMEISPEEIVAVINLVNDHYSPELMTAIRKFIYASRKSQDILNAAVPELAKLMSHSNLAVRLVVFDIFLMIRDSSDGDIPALVGAVGPLAECLDRQDIEMQGRIIRLLGRIGPDAEPAVPAIIKYLDHEDINLRRTAQTALRRIDPAKADELLGKR